jgi:bacillithiol biosynthesis cysteine-adding enzyme BshC
MSSAAPTDVKIVRIPYGKIPQLASKDLAYIEERPALRPFYRYAPTLESFAQVIEDKHRVHTDRATLVDVLLEQYRGLDIANPVGRNIESLRRGTTFTVTTAHQPSLFTGPLYYIFKIISTIRLSEILQAHYPDYQFVPVFVSGGEDHDFDEVNHLHLFGKTIVWDSAETGPVGQMTTKSLAPVLEQLKNMLGESPNARQIFETIERAHTSHAIYADSVREMVHELFKQVGLVVINMSHPALKRQAIPLFREELKERSSHRIVSQTIGQLGAEGIEPQAVPRELNLFYLLPQMRERIVLEAGQYKVLNTELEFSESEILKELDRHPERFSPNVILRPVFQEMVLPNLAYIGGGGEIAYWLERKALFEHHGINFPMLVRRNSALWIDGASAKKMDKLGLAAEEIFQETDSVIRGFLNKIAAEPLTLHAEIEKVAGAFELMTRKAAAIDPTLVKTFQAEKTNQLKLLEQLESRLLRAEKQKNEVAIGQIRGLKEKLFPGNGLQERHDNFMPYFLKNGDELFRILKTNFNPLAKEFLIFQESF